jgi:hypothetical protein
MIPYRRIMLACRTIRFLPVGFWVSTPPRSITESLRRLQRGRAGRAEAFFKQRARSGQMSIGPNYCKRRRLNEIDLNPQRQRARSPHIHCTGDPTAPAKSRVLFGGDGEVIARRRTF